MIPEGITFAMFLAVVGSAIVGVLGTIRVKQDNAAARDPETGEVSANANSRNNCCKQFLKNLGDLLCYSSTTTPCWKMMLYKSIFMFLTTLASTTVSLVLTNLVSPGDEDMEETIRRVFKFVMGDEEPTRRKRNTLNESWDTVWAMNHLETKVIISTAILITMAATLAAAATTMRWWNRRPSDKESRTANQESEVENQEPGPGGRSQAQTEFMEDTQDDAGQDRTADEERDEVTQTGEGTYLNMIWYQAIHWTTWVQQAVQDWLQGKNVRKENHGEDNNQRDQDQGKGQDQGQGQNEDKDLEQTLDKHKAQPGWFSG